MDFAFYDYTTPPRGVGRRALTLTQRAIRRALRPMLARLRDLLQNLFDRQEEDRGRAAELAARLAGLEAALRQSEAARRALAQDHLAVSRRMAYLEDVVLTAMDQPAADLPVDLPFPARPSAVLRQAS